LAGFGSGGCSGGCSGISPGFGSGGSMGGIIEAICKKEFWIECMVIIIHQLPMVLFLHEKAMNLLFNFQRYDFRKY